MVPANPEPELEAATDELYGLDPADFVAARNALVRRLRTEGNREQATRVAGLRRPSPAAWAVNQLVRQQQGAVVGLLGLGDALRRAQTDALAGADAARLRDAGRARREAVAQLAESAAGLLGGKGQGGAHYTEIVATLEAATLDGHAAAQVAGGRLNSALEPPSGFGDPRHIADETAAAPATSVSRPVPDAAEADPAAAEQAERLAEAEQAVAVATDQATTLTADAREAAVLAVRRQDEAADAEADLSRLQRRIDEARGRAAAARRGADRARKVAGSAEGAAAEAVSRLRDAEQQVANLDSP